MTPLYQSDLGGPVHAIRFDPGGRTLAAVCGAGDVYWFEVGDGVRERGVARTGAEVRDVAFRPDGAELVTVGDSPGAGGALGVLRLAPLGDAVLSRQAVEDVVDVHSAPMFVPTVEYPLLVGTVDAVYGVDPPTGRWFRRVYLGEGVGWVAPRGMAFHARERTLAVVFCSQGWATLNWYRVGKQPRFRQAGESALGGREHVTGLALSPSGRRLVVAGQDDFYVHPAEAAGDRVELGGLWLYDTAGYRPLEEVPVEASLARDFGRLALAAGDGRRRARTSGEQSDWVHLPESLMSNPVLLDDDRLALGLPGGEVRVLRLHTGKVQTLGQGEGPVRSLDHAPGPGLLAAGFRDGELRVWRV